MFAVFSSITEVRGGKRSCRLLQEVDARACLANASLRPANDSFFPQQRGSCNRSLFIPEERSCGGASELGGVRLCFLCCVIIMQMNCNVCFSAEPREQKENCGFGVGKEEAKSKKKI